MTTAERDIYTTAEEEAARAIANAIGGTLGRDFFIGHVEGSPFCATFQFDDVPRDLGAQFAVSHKLRTVAINASLRITAPRRGDIAQKLSALLAGYPYLESAGEVLDLIRLREDGFSAIYPTTVTETSPAFGAGQTTSAWAIDIGFVACFRIR